MINAADTYQETDTWNVTGRGKNAPGIASRASTGNDVPVTGPVYLPCPQKPRFPTAILQLFVESARFNLVTRKPR